jgi:hypothetical protein
VFGFSAPMGAISSSLRCCGWATAGTGGVVRGPHGSGRRGGEARDGWRGARWLPGREFEFGRKLGRSVYKLGRIRRNSGGG